MFPCISDEYKALECSHCRSTLLEQLSTNPVVKGSNPADTGHREKIAEKKGFKEFAPADLNSSQLGLLATLENH